MNATAIINNKIKEAKAANNRGAVSFWNDIKWMSTRRSMKNWTLDQLIDQYKAANAEHNITVEIAAL
jgi:hypothetical protein